MNFIEQINNEWRQKPQCSILWGMDENDYITNRDIEFLEPLEIDRVEHQQSIYLDGKFVGLLKEYDNGLFAPLTHSFQALLRDDVIIASPNFVEDEYNRMCFARLNDFIEFIEKHREQLITE